MPFRVTVSELKEIFDTDMDSGDLQAFIRGANCMVNNILADSGLDTITLKECERYISAHLASIRDPVPLRVRIGDAEAWNFPASVTTAWGKGLNLTPYGQVAMALDTSGALATMASGLRKATFRAAPREDSDRYTPRLTKS